MSLADDLFQKILHKAAQANTAASGLDEDGDGSADAEPGVTAVTETTAEEVEHSNVAPQRIHAAGVTLTNLFRHPDTHPIVLDLALLKAYGVDWFFWEMETLKHYIEDDFKPGLSSLNLEKLQAMRTLHLRPEFWERWEVFNPVVGALNNEYAEFELIRPPTVAHMMVAVDIANRVNDDVTFSSEVANFMGVVHRWDDILVPQAPLEMARVDTEGLPLDVEEVRRLWPVVQATGRVPQKVTIEHEQLRRMLLAREHLNESRDRLRAQLPVLDHVKTAAA